MCAIKGNPAPPPRPGNESPLEDFFLSDMKSGFSFQHSTEWGGKGRRIRIQGEREREEGKGRRNGGREGEGEGGERRGKGKGGKKKIL
jgi:hypothetical protein